MVVELKSVKEAALFFLKNNLTVVEMKCSDLLMLIDEGEKLLEENKKLKKTEDAKIVFAETVDKETQWVVQEENIRLRKALEKIREETKFAEVVTIRLKDVHEIASQALEVKNIPDIEQSSIQVENDHPVEDTFGSEIVEGDRYFIIGDAIVLNQNLDVYITEYLHGQICKAK